MNVWLQSNRRNRATGVRRLREKRSRDYRPGESAANLEWGGVNPSLCGWPMQQCCDMPVRANARMCAHVAEFRRTPSYKEAFTHVMRLVKGLENNIQRDEVPHATCQDCTAGGVASFGGRLHVCLHCCRFACWERYHAQQHLASTPGHVFAVCLHHSMLYCALCNDYVYDQEFDLAGASCFTSHTRVAHASPCAVKAEAAAAICDRLALEQPESKRARFQPWAATHADQLALQHHAARHVVPAHLLGLRGLLNLGSTCFMSCILQALLHNPLLRAYFLADKHGEQRCASSRRPGSVCLACEMDHLFGEMFARAQKPFAPARFLYSMWRHTDNLAGYEQQDAHEFFMALIDGIHTHITSATIGAANGASHGADCTCIVHQAFGATLRSDVTCLTCATLSTSLDPCLDVALDLPAPRAARSVVPQQSSAGWDDVINMEDGLSGDGSGALDGSDAACSLADCFARFTHPEMLGHEDRLQLRSIIHISYAFQNLLVFVCSYRARPIDLCRRCVRRSFAYMVGIHGAVY